ncbi:MAG: zinc ABC transporter substrate-binding protein [Planctomycetes bacterium]|nr:zinc ABC transporter substrate-binding protein [Planctomycetota bacterium]MCA8935223.1 zinc ABC transporter substrate-binding protein [Planctomycetota bacterium]MCA8947820.1 zinc ABC transporter substrate-binding protein [Planctomycetota bacterium]
MKRFIFALLVLVVLASVQRPVLAEDDKLLQVCATLPDLGKLVEAVGGEHVEVTSFAKGSDDPHHLEAKPSFITELADADVLVLNGMELEEGWLPVLLRQCRNGWVQKGADGYIDASSVITPLDTPIGDIDRSQGDVHAAGNPHYLADPLNGLKVAELLRDRFAKLLPKHKEDFEDNFKTFKAELGKRLVGEKLAEKYDFTKLARLFEFNKLTKFLDQQGEASLLEGWLKDLQPNWGTKVVTDHKLWSYFSKRFGIEVCAELEPLPGAEPTSGHLKKVIEIVKEKGVKLILTVSYFNEKHAKFVSDRTDARQVRLAHLVGATDGDDDDYLDMVGYNVKQVVDALKK